MKKLFVLLALAAIVGETVALAAIQVPAVDAGGEGIITIITASVKAGNGKQSLVISDNSLSHFFSVETQQSIKNAVAAAAALANINKSNFDYEFDIKANAEVVDGPSGGAAVAVAVLSEYTGKKIRRDIAVSGAISPEGILSKVGGIAAKAEAAGKQEIRVFVVPAGQSVQDDVDLSVTALEKYGMQVVEARTLEQVAEYAFTPEASSVAQANITVPELQLQKVVLNNAGQLKPIAQDAISSVAEKLAAMGKTPLAATANKSVQLARKLLENNYVYSAANEAFVTLVTLRGVEYANYSKEKLEEKLLGVEGKLNASEKIVVTDVNLEWVVSSQLRQHWAKTKLSEARKSLGSDKLHDAAQAIATAGLWQEASQSFNAIALNQKGRKPLDANKSKEIAAEKIAAAENDTTEAGDPEARFHLDAAKAEFASGDYETAAVDAGFASAFASAINENSEKLPSEAMQGTPDANESTRYKTAWAQYYFAHGVYNKQEWKRTGDASYAINALKLYSLAREFDEIMLQLASGNGSAVQSTPAPQNNEANQPQISVVVTEVPQQGIDKNILYAAIAVIAVAIALLLLALRAGGQRQLGKSATAREFERKLDRLDELLVEGKISEENYSRLRGKYEAILEKLSEALENEEETAQAKKKKR